MHLKFYKIVTFQDYNSKMAKTKQDSNKKEIAKIADLQAQNASQREAF